MGELRQNLRYAVRFLAKQPGFTAVAIISLALGIGANTAIFSLINGLLLRDLPVRHPEQLVEVSLLRRDGRGPFPYLMFRELDRGQKVFTGLIGMDLGYQWHSGKMFNVEVNGILSQSRVLSVTGNFYTELGMTPLLGRLLNPQDADPRGGSASQVTVISYEFWQQHFGRDADVLGKKILIEGQPFLVVGVTRKGFTGFTRGEPPEITLPITGAPLVQDGQFGLERGGAYWLFIVGRLKDGVTLEKARAQIEALWPDVLRAEASTVAPGPRLQSLLSTRVQLSSAAVGLSRDLRSQFARPLYILAGLAGLVLVIACVNLANLMLARGAARGHEMSVRVALGASRVSLVRQSLTESLLLSAGGALLALVFAYPGSRLLVFLISQRNPIPLTVDLSPDLRVLCFTASLAIVTAILFGLAPAWRCAAEDPRAMLQQRAGNLAGGAGKLSKALISSQVALSLILLMGAGLLVRSFDKLRFDDFGAQMEHVLEISLYPKPGGYQELDVNNYHKQLFDSLSVVPGVLSAAYSNNSIVGGAEERWREDVSSASADPATAVTVKSSGTWVSPGFFRTLGIRLARGRDFNQTDDEGHTRVAIVNRSLAERLFPDTNPIGKTVRMGMLPCCQNIEIVGVANNARLFDLRDKAAPVIFLSYLQTPPKWGAVVVRTREAPELLAKALDQAIQSLGHEYPLWTETIDQVVSGQLANDRVTALLSAFFAVLALMLASMGLYGLMSYTVTLRTREIGIRVALGAQRENVLWIVLRETLALALFGIAIGIPAGLAAGRLIAAILFGLSSSNLPTLAAVSLLLLAVALLAGYLPARRASRVDPIVALRTE